MLALARMNHLTKASNLGNNSNSSTNNDEHLPSMSNNEKMLLLNPNIGQEPTTPCVLNTPNTCTKNSTFFYEIPSGVHTPTLNGKFCLFFTFSADPKGKRKRTLSFAILCHIYKHKQLACFSFSFLSSLDFNHRQRTEGKCQLYIAGICQMIGFY